MKMVQVPAGQFLMGATSADTDADPQEKPPHTVYLDAFWIDRTEVTNAQYARFLNAQGGHRARCGGQDCIRTRAEGGDSHIQQQDGQYSAQSSFGSHPVIEVSWYGAQAYCRWAGGRLPTEAEWEKAGRGTTGHKYPWGNSFGGGKANTCDRNCPAENRKTGINDRYARTAPVGSFQAGASPYGVLDMAGNVWEWVSDWYGEAYYRSSPASNPQGPSSGGQKVIRGGSWRFVPWYSRATARDGDNPAEMFAGVGFRCVNDEAPKGE
jgi:serine/threonine-protein kinase